MNNIHKTINLIMSDMEAVTKDSKNVQQGYKFRGIDAVMNTLKPLFAKYKLFVCPKVLEQTREERATSKGGNLIYSILKVKYTFYAEDGSNVEVIVVGEGMDSGDKASNKAMSIAFKYACFQVFCIPTEDVVDPDTETPPASIKAPTPPTPPTQEQLAELKELNIDLSKLVAYYKLDNEKELTKEMIEKAIKQKREANIKKAKIEEEKLQKNFKKLEEAGL